MAFWLYQMSGSYWPHERYRSEVWEDAQTTWGFGKITPAGSSPQPGDMVILFYAKGGAVDPGIYGWAIVLWRNGKEIRFRPVSPSDYLKMNPLWNDEVSDIIDEIRGKVARGTMWEIDSDQMRRLRQRVAEDVYGIPPKS